MTEASFASLNPTLLARKGGAKPAMRPQLGPIPNPTAESLEDLGWNDMGQDVEGTKTADVVQLKPANADGDTQQPIIRKQHEKLNTKVEQDNFASPKKQTKPRQSAVKQGKRAAFTLRLDPDRHLKLRLAATLQGKSAQSLVTQALDAMLETMEELDSLTARIKRN